MTKLSGSPRKKESWFVKNLLGIVALVFVWGFALVISNVTEIRIAFFAFASGIVLGAVLNGWDYEHLQKRVDKLEAGKKSGKRGKKNKGR